MEQTPTTPPSPPPHQSLIDNYSENGGKLLKIAMRVKFKNDAIGRALERLKSALNTSRQIDRSRRVLRPGGGEAVDDGNHTVQDDNCEKLQKAVDDTIKLLDNVYDSQKGHLTNVEDVLGADFDPDWNSDISVEYENVQNELNGGFNHRANGRRSRKRGRSVSLRSNSKPRSRTKRRLKRSSSRSK